MKTLVIDTNNLLHRVFWVSQKNPLINSRGEDVSILYHALNTVKAYVNFLQPTTIYLAWDKTLQYPALNFRKNIRQVTQAASYSKNTLGYKAGRDLQRNAEVYKHGEVVGAAAALLGCRNIYPNKLEADDVIAWLSKNLSDAVIILSSDKDLYQLITERVSIYNAQKKQFITLQNFEEITGVLPTQYVDYKALIGDTSDNIKGVYGYGPVKATKLIKSGGITNLTEEQQAVFKTNKQLMDLSIGYQIEVGEEAAYKDQLQQHTQIQANFTAFEDLCKYMEFKSFLTNFEDWKASFSSSPQERIIRIKNNP